MIQDPIALLAFMFGIVALSRLAEARFKAVQHISSAVLCTLLGIALANLGVIPHTSALHTRVYEFAVPYAIVLVILSTRLSDLKIAGRPLLIGFGLAAIGSVAGGLISGMIFHRWVGPETWKVAGQFVAAFVGGGVNFVAVGRGLETSPSMFAAANVADNLSTVPWMLAQMTLASLLAPYYRKGLTEIIDEAGGPPVLQAAAADEGSIARAIEENPRDFWTVTTFTTGQLALVAALPLAVLWAARSLSPVIPGLPEVLWLTTIALVLAQIPQLAGIRRAAAVGSYFALHLFFIALGAGSIIGDVLKAGPSLLIFMTLIILIHAVIVYGVGWLIGLDLRSLTIASQATIGGPGSALALSLSLKWRSLVTPGILVGILGYAVGNYFGFACAYLLPGVDLMSRGPLSGTRALITGSGRGLGRAIAIGLAEAGASVWITARTETEVARTAAAIRERGGAVVSCLADLADPAGCARLATEIGPELDVLVNNAAVLDLLPLEALTPEIWSRALAVNLTAPYLLTRAWLKPMRVRGGSIINVSSRAGVRPFANEAAYCAAKFGLEGFTRAVALELAGAPVSITTVTPGLRIKPTSISDETAAASADPAWQDASVLVPAFTWLARDRGGVSGLRFDAQRLSAALAADPHLSVERARAVAEPILEPVTVP